MTVYYHGGVGGLRPGMMILPPTVTGAPSCSEYGGDHVHRRDRVYVATDINAAYLYAAMHPSNKGTVYVYDPVGVIETDEDCNQPGLSFSCERATVVKVIRVYPSDRDKIRRMMLFGESTAA